MVTFHKQKADISTGRFLGRKVPFAREGRRDLASRHSTLAAGGRVVREHRRLAGLLALPWVFKVLSCSKRIDLLTFWFSNFGNHI